VCGYCERSVLQRGALLRAQAMRWAQALEQYTLALSVDATNEQYNLKLYNNRAAVYMK
jgi:hypothetical protein